MNAFCISQKGRKGENQSMGFSMQLSLCMQLNLHCSDGGLTKSIEMEIYSFVTLTILLISAENNTINVFQ